MSLLVNEIFADCWQGEGHRAGQLCTFLRLSTCNLHCTWCDTPYTWAFTERQAKQHQSGVQYSPFAEVHRMELARVVDRIVDIATGNLIVVSGGEPMLQQEELYKLICMLERRGFIITVETAGTIVPSSQMVEEVNIDWSVSPKLSHSGNEHNKRFNEKALLAYSSAYACFKFVCGSVDDLAEVATIQSTIGMPDNRIWIMPEGTDAETILKKARELAPFVLKYKWNLTLRQHVLLYGNERAR